MPQPLGSNLVARIGRALVAEWRIRAQCNGADPELFFPMRGLSGRGGQTRRTIQQYCEQCPVIDECLAEGMQERFGVWGGKTPEERKAIRAARKRTIRSIM